MSESRHSTETLRVGIAQPVTQWDPHEAQDWTTHFVLGQVYETPFARLFVGEEQPEPRLFSSGLEAAAIGATGMRYRAEIVPGRRFSDGTPVTAEHIAASLRRSGPLLQLVRVSAEEHAVVFEADRPRPRLDVSLSRRWCAIALERDGEFFGTGPFMKAADSRADRVHLVRNPHHRRSLQAAFDDIVFEVYPRSRMADLAADLEAGYVHCTMALSVAHARDLRKVQTAIRPGDSTGILYFNTERPALASRLVRRGLVSAIDRYKLTRIAYPDTAGFTAKGPVPPSLGRSTDGQRPDRAAAAEMLAGLETSEAEPLRMLVVWADRPYLPEPAAVAEELVRQFAAVGVHVQAIPAQDADDFGRHVRAGDYDLVLGGWIAESDDPGDFLESLVYSGAIPREGASSGAANFSRWRDAPVDELVDRFRNGGSGPLLDQIVDRISDEAPFLALMHGAVVASYSERLRNFSPTGGYVPALSGVELRPAP